jgi:hypothetical protein
MAGNRFEVGKNTAKQLKSFIFARLVVMNRPFGVFITSLKNKKNTPQA